MSGIQKLSLAEISLEEELVLARPVILGTGVKGFNSGVKITDKVIAALKRLGFEEVWISKDADFEAAVSSDNSDLLTPTEKFQAIKEDISNSLADIMTEKDPARELLRMRNMGHGDVQKMMENGLLYKMDPERPAREVGILKKFSNMVISIEKLNNFQTTCRNLIEGQFSPRNIDSVQLNLSDNRTEGSYIFNHLANSGLYFLATIARYNADLKSKGAVSSELKFTSAFDHDKRKKTTFYFSDDESVSGSLGSFMHDIGYLHSGMPEILAKQALLTKEEHGILKNHVQVSMNILQYHPFFETKPLSMNVIENHHERLDGTGYPKGRKNFHIFSRILSIIDCFDSLTTDRPWRRKFARSKVLQWLYDNSGETSSPGGVMSSAIFDRELVTAFENILLLYEKGELVDIYHEKATSPVFRCVITDYNKGRPDRPIVELLHCYSDTTKDVKGKVVNMLHTRELYLGESTEFKKEPIR